MIPLNKTFPFSTTPVAQANSIRKFDYTACPQYGQNFLFKNPTLWFQGILNFCYNSCGRDFKQIPPNELTIKASRWEENNPPKHALIPDPRLHFSTQKQFRDNGGFLGFSFYRIKIRPSAICIKSYFPFRHTLSQDALRSFVVVGSRLNAVEKEIIADFNYTDELKRDKAIFYINTEKYYQEIYIQQTGASFNQSLSFSIEQIEIHGYICYVDK